MGSLARHLVTPTLKTDFHREGIFRPSANRKSETIELRTNLDLDLDLDLLDIVGT